MTVLGYFNSLRELGGSRRIVEDEISSRLTKYGQKRRSTETDGLFANREVDIGRIVELTSRESTAKVAEARRRLSLEFHEKERVDVALATNMISVGLDITRLGLMVVLGQPKMTAEYIQATSRVGRDEQRPGLVVTLLNLYKPRDRSHYERFGAYHETFYRGVEATSVTPFSPRALDRAIAGVTVALARHSCADLTAPKAAGDIAKFRAVVNSVADVLARRAEGHRSMSKDEADERRKKVRDTVMDLLDSWEKIAGDAGGAGLQYQREEGQAPPLLLDPMDPELARKTPNERKFRAHRSMRDVEPSVNLWINEAPDAEEDRA
jgi:superfamily II DNA/RNA helicase